jgi:hypothetical protein
MWCLKPQFSGDLLSDEIAPSQLGGSQTFEGTLSLRTSAKMALIRADEDQRLLRRYAGTIGVMPEPVICARSDGWALHE